LIAPRLTNDASDKELWIAHGAVAHSWIPLQVSSSVEQIH